MENFFHPFIPLFSQIGSLLVDCPRDAFEAMAAFKISPEHHDTMNIFGRENTVLFD